MRRFFDKKSIVALLAIVANVLYVLADTSDIAGSWYAIVVKALVVLGLYTCDTIVECAKAKVNKSGDLDGTEEDEKTGGSA